MRQLQGIARRLVLHSSRERHEAEARKQRDYRDRLQTLGVDACCVLDSLQAAAAALDLDAHARERMQHVSGSAASALAEVIVKARR